MIGPKPKQVSPTHLMRLTEIVSRGVKVSGGNVKHASPQRHSILIVKDPSCWKGRNVIYCHQRVQGLPWDPLTVGHALKTSKKEIKRYNQLKWFLLIIVCPPYEEAFICVSKAEPSHPMDKTYFIWDVVLSAKIHISWSEVWIGRRTERWLKTFNL